MYLQKFFLKTKEKSKNRISSNAEKEKHRRSERSVHPRVYIYNNFTKWKERSPDRSVDQNPNPPT